MKRVLLGVSMLALLIVVASVMGRLALPSDHPEAPELVPTLRGGGGSPQPIAPVGRVDRLRDFVWRGPMYVSAFRIEIRDTRGALIHDERIRQRYLRLTPELKGRLRPGVEYHWTVSRLDERGVAIAVSPQATFTVPRR